MWDFSSLTRNQTRGPGIGRQILNHWTTGEVPNLSDCCIREYLSVAALSFPSIVHYTRTRASAFNHGADLQPELVVPQLCSDLSEAQTEPCPFLRVQSEKTTPSEH